MLSDIKYTKEIITRTVRLRLLENGIIYYTYLPNAEIDEKNHLENHKALVEITNNQKHPLLIDSNEYTTVTPEGRKMIRELEPVAPITVRAVVIKSLGHRILTNFYIKFHQPIVTTKIFDDYKEALDYLHFTMNPTLPVSEI